MEQERKSMERMASIRAQEKQAEIEARFQTQIDALTDQVSELSGKLEDAQRQAGHLDTVQAELAAAQGQATLALQERDEAEEEVSNLSKKIRELEKDRAGTQERMSVTMNQGPLVSPKTVPPGFADLSGDTGQALLKDLSDKAWLLLGVYCSGNTSPAGFGARKGE